MSALEAVNMTTPTKWLVYANQATYGWFGISVLLAVFVIVLTHLMRNDTPKAFAASSLITLTIAVFFRLMEVVNDLTIGLVLTAFLLSVMWDGFSAK